MNRFNSETGHCKSLPNKAAQILDLIKCLIEIWIRMNRTWKGPVMSMYFVPIYHDCMRKNQRLKKLDFYDAINNPEEDMPIM